jgi:hypothetical protein
MERDPAYVMGSGVGGEVGAAVEDRFGAFHEAPSKCEAIERPWPSVSGLPSTPHGCGL